MYFLKNLSMCLSLGSSERQPKTKASVQIIWEWPQSAGVRDKRMNGERKSTTWTGYRVISTATYDRPLIPWKLLRNCAKCISEFSAQGIKVGSISLSIGLCSPLAKWGLTGTNFWGPTHHFWVELPALWEDNHSHPIPQLQRNPREGNNGLLYGSRSGCTWANCSKVQKWLPQ